MRLQMYSKAHYAFQQAIFIESMNPMIWTSIGQLFVQIGQYADALSAYSNAIHLKPDMYETWYELGQLCEYYNQIFNAIEAYKGALQLSPGNWILRDHIQDLMKRTTEGSKEIGFDSSCFNSDLSTTQSDDVPTNSISSAQPIETPLYQQDEDLMETSLVAYTSETPVSKPVSHPKCLAKDKSKESSVAYFILSY